MRDIYYNSCDALWCWMKKRKMKRGEEWTKALHRPNVYPHLQLQGADVKICPNCSRVLTTVLGKRFINAGILRTNKFETYHKLEKKNGKAPWCKGSAQKYSRPRWSLWKFSSLYKAETGRLKVILLLQVSSHEFEPTFIILVLICKILPDQPK